MCYNTDVPTRWSLEYPAQVVNFPYGDHLYPRGAKMTENSVFSCFLAKNRLFGPKGCLDRENCHHKEDLPLE